LDIRVVDKRCLAASSGLLVQIMLVSGGQTNAGPSASSKEVVE
jgi:hypothetical protein